MADADGEVPLVYRRRAGVVRLSYGARLICAAVAACCVAVLVTGAWLSPSPAGFGSHTTLGFSRCEFLARTGLPCPSCGMTTSFSWFARGNLLASGYVQPMGLVLAVLSAGAFWIAGYSALTGRPLYRLIMANVSQRYHVVPLLVVALGGWAWKILIHLRGIDGWR